MTTKKPAERRSPLAMLSTASSTWHRPARWITLLLGVGSEWTARYMGAPMWMRLLAIVATVVLLMLITMDMNKALLSETERRQKSRSLAIAGALFALVGVFYAATIVRLGPNALNKATYNRPEGTKPAVEAPAVKEPGKPGAIQPPTGDCKKAGTC